MGSVHGGTMLITCVGWVHWVYVGKVCVCFGDIHVALGGFKKSKNKNN